MAIIEKHKHAYARKEWPSVKRWCCVAKWGINVGEKNLRVSPACLQLCTPYFRCPKFFVSRLIWNRCANGSRSPGGDTSKSHPIFLRHFSFLLRKKQSVFNHCGLPIQFHHVTLTLGLCGNSGTQMRATLMKETCGVNVARGRQGWSGEDRQSDLTPFPKKISHVYSSRVAVQPVIQPLIRWARRESRHLHLHLHPHRKRCWVGWAKRGVKASY